MIRYIIEPKILDKTHPLWPGQELFFIKDLQTGRVSLSCYTKREVASKIVDRKNGV